MDEDMTVLLGGAILGMFAGIALGVAITGDYWRAKAIKAGKAEWVLVTPASSRTEWRWKP